VGCGGTIAVMFNHSQRVRKTAMHFFKSTLRRPLFGFCGGPRFGGKRGCGRHGDRTPEQRAERRDRMVDRAADKLQLTAEQKPLLATLLDAMAAQRQAMIGQTTDMRAELRSWFGGSSFDAARAQALINDKANVLQSESPDVVAALGAFFDSLNPAQQQKVRNLLDGPRGWFRRG
jgi:Spy/CpxP family protein refolding chaperone